MLLLTRVPGLSLLLMVSLAAGGCASARSGGRSGSGGGRAVAGLFESEGEGDGKGDRDADGIPDAVDREESTSDAGGAVAETGSAAPAPARGFFHFGANEGADKKIASKAPPIPSPAPTTSAEPPKDETAPEKPAEPPAPPSENKGAEASGPRLVIYKGNLTLLVTAVEASVEKLSARAKELGGFVENQTGNAGANSAVLTLRIPAEKFYDVITELGSYGQVTEKQISAEDVTKQVFDVELRLDTAEKARARLQELLKQATKMEEILQIENEVRRLTDEIEGMKGQLRFLKDQVSLSTLTVSFYSNAPPPTSNNARTRSRFDWINKVGIESVLGYF